MTDRRHSIDLGRDERLVTTVEVGADPFVVSIRGVVRTEPVGEWETPTVLCSRCGRIGGMPTRAPEDRLNAMTYADVDRHVQLHEDENRVAADPFHGLTEGN